MKPRTYLAFDFGERRIGVAIGNDLTATARSLTTIEACDDDERFAAVKRLVNEWIPDAFIVGRPSHPDGTAHEMTARCERFARQLHGRFAQPTYLVDERYSSVDAAQALTAHRSKATLKKAAIDAEAAAEILRRYFAEGAVAAA